MVFVDWKVVDDKLHVNAESVSVAIYCGGVAVAKGAGVVGFACTEPKTY